MHPFRNVCLIIHFSPVACSHLYIAPLLAALIERWCVTVKTFPDFVEEAIAPKLSAFFIILGLPVDGLYAVPFCR